MQKSLPEAFSRLNITQRNRGAFAALLGEAHQYLVTGLLMRLGFLVSVITVRGGTFDLIIPAYENFTQDREKVALVRAQVRTIKQSLRFTGGVRAGVDRIYLPEVKGYKYTPRHNDLIIGVDQSILDLYLVPTRYIERWGNSVSKSKLQPLKNNWQILLNWNDDFLAQLGSEL